VETPRGDAGLSTLDRVAELGNRFYDRIRRDDAMKAAEGEPAASGFGHLAGHSYCLVVTYKRSGEPVPTPVWFGSADGNLYTRTAAVDWKVKRIRNNPRVLVGPCTVRGKPRGPLAERRARVLAPDEEDHAEATLQSKYGLVRRLYEVVAGYEGVYLEVSPNQEAS